MDLFDVVVAKKLSGGSGGNPNRVQTITGTVATPIGGDNSGNLFALISEAIFNNTATAKMSITAGQQTGWAYLSGNNSGNLLMGYASMVNDDSFLTMKVAWNLAGGSIIISDFKSIQGADGSYQVTDLMSMASMCTTELTIIWHPLP